jgi:hypothetical protein
MSQPAIWGAFTSGPANPTDYSARINDSLNALLSANSGSSAPSYKVLGTYWADTSVAGVITLKMWDGGAWRTIFAVATATGALTFVSDPWAFQPIGVPVAVLDNLSGVSAPPTNLAYRYVKLTAGLTGSGSYNNGILTSETVSGSAPLVSATAVINLSSSPLNGQTVRLINTERRFLRAYDAAGTVMDDAFQGHRMNNLDGTFWVNKVGGTAGSTGYNLGATNTTGDPVTDGTNGTPRTANETRGKFIGATYFMRIL